MKIEHKIWKCQQQWEMVFNIKISLKLWSGFFTSLMFKQPSTFKHWIRKQNQNMSQLEELEIESLSFLNHRLILIKSCGDSQRTCAIVRLNWVGFRYLNVPFVPYRLSSIRWLSNVAAFTKEPILNQHQKIPLYSGHMLVLWSMLDAQWRPTFFSMPRNVFSRLI